MPLRRYFRRLLINAAVSSKLLMQKFIYRKQADCFFGCANEWRYPAFLFRALQQAGISTWETPVPGAEFFIRNAGWAYFFRNVYLIRENVAAGAKLVVSRDARAAAVPGALYIEIDYFSESASKQGLIMPYFIHPDFWECAGEFTSLQAEFRRNRVGFAGTMTEDGYSAGFAFPILNRAQILKFIQAEFSTQAQIIRSLDEYRSAAERRPIVLVLVQSGGDSTAKHILRGRDYLGFLGSCTFFIAPPGAVMPFAHNLIEAMFLGAIPILNYGHYLSPPLVDEVNCLSYATIPELRGAIEKALAMSQSQIRQLQAGVKAYVDNYLSVASFAEKLRGVLGENSVIVVNDESKSVALLHSR